MDTVITSFVLGVMRHIRAFTVRTSDSTPVEGVWVCSTLPRCEWRLIEGDHVVRLHAKRLCDLLQGTQSHITRFLALIPLIILVLHLALTSCVLLRPTTLFTKLF